MLRASVQLLKGTAACSAALVTFTALSEAAPSRARRGVKTELASIAPVSRGQLVRTPTVAPVPQMPLLAIVSLSAQTITLYAGGIAMVQAPISSGMDGFRTPTGVFSVIQKNKYHESNIYSGAPMPFMQRLTWSGIALHAGKLPGYRASHGCIRLPYDFAEQLFSLTRMGARVIVTHEVVAPQVVAHARLPVPVMTPYAMTASVHRGVTSSALTLASAGSPISDGPNPDVPVQLLLNPMQVAEVEKRRLASAHIEANQNVKAALETAQASAQMSDTLRAKRAETERHVGTFAEMAANARNRLVLATSAEDRLQAEASLYAAEEAVEDAKTELGIARAAEAAASDASFASARLAREQENLADAAEQASKLAIRGTEPITVFVSRKEGRVMVRQGWQTILEGAVTFLDPKAPLGTHVFTAIAAENAALRWTSVSNADGAVVSASAVSALDRVVIEPDFAAEIGKRLWTGATLILSDQGISTETGKGTDFVVLTK